MFQSVIIAGNLGRDPEMQYTASGKAVTKFSVAVSTRKNETEWFNVVCWERTAELAAQYLRKGSKALVSGRMQTRSWDNAEGVKQYRTELIADSVRFLDPRGANDGDPDGLPSRDVSSRDIDPDDLPFAADPSFMGWQQEYGEAFR